MLLKIILFITIYAANCLSENLDFNIRSIHRILKSNKYTCVDVVQFFMNRAVKYNKQINAIISYNPNYLLQAFEIDKYYNDSKKFVGRLHCIPFGIKDNIDVIGFPTTGGIKALRYSYPNKNALVIERLKSEGAIILFKTNLGELAYGSVVSELGGECMNPFDPKRNCGPSSFGSGAAVSSGLAILSLGTDSSGSVLTPGSFNGLFSLRPAMNMTPLDGIIPLFERVDTVGTFAKYLDDLVLSFSIMANDENFMENYNKQIEKSTLKLGILSNFVNDFNITFINNFKFATKYKIDPEVKQLMDSTVQKFKNLGLTVHEYSISQTEFENLINLLADIYNSLFGCIASSKKNSMDLYFNDTTRFQYDSPVKSFEQLFMSPFLSAFWKNDFNTSLLLSKEENSCNEFDTKRQVIIEAVKKLYEIYDLDAIMIPTSTQLPDLLNFNDADLLTSMIIISSFTGYSALNIPVGYSKTSSDAPDGLPVGMTLISRPEKMVNSFKIAKLYETWYGIVRLPSRMALGNNSTKFEFNILFFGIIIFKSIFKE